MTYNGLCFTDMNKDVNCFELTLEKIATSSTNPGFYFIHAKLKQIGSTVVIYCGQSLGSIRSKLTDHYHKFYDTSPKGAWVDWYKENSMNIDSLYYSTFDSDYGAAYENFIIYKRVVGITFCLNKSLNVHSNLLNIHDVSFTIQTLFAHFTLALASNCDALLSSAAHLSSIVYQLDITSTDVSPMFTTLIIMPCQSPS